MNKTVAKLTYRVNKSISVMYTIDSANVVVEMLLPYKHDLQTIRKAIVLSAYNQQFNLFPDA